MHRMFNPSFTRKTELLFHIMMLLSLHVLTVSVWIFSGYSGFLPQLREMQIGVGSMGDSSLTVGVNVRVDGCLSLQVILPKDPSAWRLGKPGIKPPTFWLEDALPYLAIRARTASLENVYLQQYNKNACKTQCWFNLKNIYYMYAVQLD